MEEEKNVRKCVMGGGVGCVVNGLVFILHGGKPKDMKLRHPEIAAI